MAATLLIGALVVTACEHKPQSISSEYPEEMSALAKPGKGVPYIVGKDLRPVWNLANAPKPREMLPFELTDQAGHHVSLESLKGKIAIVSFFFSKCPGICPLTTKNLRAVQEKFKNNDKVVMLSLSVTPEHDSPKVLDHYAKENKIDGRRWHLLTGNRDKIYELARKSFSADTMSKREGYIEKVTEKDFLHSENVYLLDSTQKLRGVYAGKMVSSLNELARDAEALLQ